MYFSSEDFMMNDYSVHLRQRSGLARDRGLKTIDMLPDDVLVEIFFYVNVTGRELVQSPWHALVHVCRRWRYLVFGLPRLLNLQIEYGGGGPMSEVPDAWQVLPVIVISRVGILRRTHRTSGRRWYNRVVALESEHSNRICEIHIDDMTKSRWERFTAAMQKPFPELTHLEVWVDDDSDVAPVLPDSFLGGSAPHLRTLSLRSIPFPLIPKLLLSTNGLVTLSLWDIPDSGYISPDAMATALTAMTRLETLHLRFRSPRSRPDAANRLQPPPTRFVLPALTELMFGGVCEYLEDLLARIDVPLLYDLLIIFFMNLNFEVPQLHWLIGHAEEFRTIDYAELLILNDSIRLNLSPKTRALDHRRLLQLQINCRDLDWQLSSLAQVCNLSFPLISTLEELEIREYDHLSSSHWKDDIEDTQWLELLDPFTDLKILYLTHEMIAQRVCGALRNLSGQRATEVLPALSNLFVPAHLSVQSVREAATARRLSGYPVIINYWEGKFAE